MNFRTVIAVATVAGGVGLLTGQQAEGGVLVGGAFAANAMPGFNGTKAFAGSVGSFVYSADVDYAVFAPGDFTAAAGGGTDPSGGSEYVYAYQIHHTGVTGNQSVNILSVGMPQKPGSNIGHLEANGGGDHGINPGGSPTYTYFVGSYPTYTSAVWTFANAASGLVTPGQWSEILMFTSPTAPDYYNASVKAGAVIDTDTLPTPVPEPATGLLAAGAVATAVAARRRR